MTMTKNNKNEAGRSMVEMLGVLAIIGVLSIGAIAGYTYAMDKRKANDIVNEVNKRAIIGASQMVLTGTINLSEFSTKVSEYNISAIDSANVNRTEFGIQVSGVPKGVCNRLLDMTDNWDELLEYAPATCADENNTMEFIFAGDLGEGNRCSDIVCPENTTCIGGICICNDGLELCGTQCCAEGTYCSAMSVTCITPTGCSDEDVTCCTANSDCKDENMNIDTTKYCKIGAGGPFTPKAGKCTDKGTLSQHTVAGVTVYKNGEGLNWWSAINLCKAHKKQLVTMADLGISDNGQRYCYFDSEKRISDEYDTTYQCNCINSNNCTQTTTELYTIGTSGQLWLANMSTPMQSRSIALEDGYVNWQYSRMSVAANALCR